jgi:hypothetical protein
MPYCKPSDYADAKMTIERKNLQRGLKCNKYFQIFQRTFRTYPKKNIEKFVCLKPFATEVVIYLIVIGHPIIIWRGKIRHLILMTSIAIIHFARRFVFFTFSTN